MPTENDLREALEDMLFQFGYRGVKDGKRILHTGGLSALEHAFGVLGWEDPHVVTDDSGCEIAGCHDWASCVGPYPRSRAKASTASDMAGFGYLCTNHYFTWSGTEAVAADDLGRLK